MNYILLIKRLGAVLVLILIALGALYFYQSSQFRIVSTDPKTAQMTTWTPFFKINFNKKVSQSGLSITSSPQIIYNNQIKVSDKTITIYLNVPLDPNQTYTISLHNLVSVGNQHIANRLYTFKPVSVSRSQLSDDEQEVLIKRNQNSKTYQDPILSHLPYSGVDFNLTSSFGAAANNEPVLTLQAELLLHLAQLGDKNSAEVQDKQEVLDYIRSIGLDPSKYTINYTVVSP